jgi:argininosuccinate lyase
MGAPHRKGVLRKEMDPEAAAYTSSSTFDREIYEATVYVNIAHLRALEKLGVISRDAADRGVAVLSRMLRERVELPPDVEDIHIHVETLLSKEVPEAGENLALGKSRNDAVVAAIKIRLRERTLQLCRQLADCIQALLEKSVEESATIFPVYTHLQRAAPATYGFILHAYAVRLYKTLPAFRKVLEECEESPLGSAAVAGTTVPLDRQYLAELLGFRKTGVNALESTASREFIIMAMSALLTAAVVLSSIAEEFVLYSSEEFGLVEVQEELAATSSIMPQKRNPVVAEVMRTKAAEVMGLLTSVEQIVCRMPSGYSLDLQQATPKLWSAFQELESSLRLLAKLVKGVSVRRERALYACMPPVAAVELANHLTLKHGIPFRKAHTVAGQVSRLMAERRLSDEALKQVLKEHGVEVGLGVSEVFEIMDPVKTVERYALEGSANPRHVLKSAQELLRELVKIREWLENESRVFRETLGLLLR